MKVKKTLFYAVLFVLWPSHMLALTLSYSLKNHQIIRAPAQLQSSDEDSNLAKLARLINGSHTTVTAIPIYYTRDRHIVNTGVDVHDHSVVGGTLLGWRYVSGSEWWVDILTGIETEHVRSHGTTNLNVSRTGIDDVVAELGCTKQVTDVFQAAWYVTGGAPTRTKVMAYEVFNTLVGTRFFSAGFGGELYYSFIKEFKQALVASVQARFLHFFDRHWTPILPNGSFIQPGNELDFLISLRYRSMRSIFELGYTPSILLDPAVIVHGTKSDGPEVARNTVYFTATHFTESVGGSPHPFIIGMGISGGTGSRFNTKLFSWWLNVSTLF